MKPGYQLSNPVPMCVAPFWPRSSSACAIDIPIRLTVRHMSGCTWGEIGSAKGGIQMRVGKGELWWWL